MTEKKITQIKKKPNQIPSFKDVITDYKKLTSGQLLEKTSYLVSYQRHDPENLTSLYHFEIERRLTQARKDGKKPEVSLNMFRELMRLTKVNILQNMMTHRIEIKSEKFKSIEVMGLAEEQRVLLVKEVCRQ